MCGRALKNLLFIVMGHFYFVGGGEVKEGEIRRTQMHNRGGETQFSISTQKATKMHDNDLESDQLANTLVALLHYSPPPSKPQWTLNNSYLCKKKSSIFFWGKIIFLCVFPYLSIYTFKEIMSSCFVRFLGQLTPLKAIPSQGSRKKKLFS